MKIDKHCFKVSGVDNCLHWAAVKNDGDYTLYWSSECNPTHDENTIVVECQEESQAERNTCGNPWNVVCLFPEFEKKVRSAKPQTERYAGSSVRSKVYTLDEVVKGVE